MHFNNKDNTQNRLKNYLVIIKAQELTNYFHKDLSIVTTKFIINTGKNNYKMKFPKDFK